MACFDWAFQPKLDRRVVEDLFTLSCVERHENWQLIRAVRVLPAMDRPRRTVLCQPARPARQYHPCMEERTVPRSPL
jgi:hypothetical protein